MPGSPGSTKSNTWQVAPFWERSDCRALAAEAAALALYGAIIAYPSEHDSALDIVCCLLDGPLLRGDFPACDALLQLPQLDGAPLAVLLTALTITLRHADKLPSRSRVVALARAAAEKAYNGDPEQVRKALVGLG